MPRLPSALPGVAALLAAGLVCAPAAADDAVASHSATFKLGETRQLAVFGGHRSDCVTSLQPDAIRIVQAPRLGTLSQRVGAPYTVGDSISGTCLGYRLIGTAVDYTARTPGTDTVVLDAVFSNGTRRHMYTVTVTP